MRQAAQDNLGLDHPDAPKARIKHALKALLPALFYGSLTMIALVYAAIRLTGNLTSSMPELNPNDVRTSLLWGGLGLASAGGVAALGWWTKVIVDLRRDHQTMWSDVVHQTLARVPEGLEVSLTLQRSGPERWALVMVSSGGRMRVEKHGRRLSVGTAQLEHARSEERLDQATTAWLTTDDEGWQTASGEPVDDVVVEIGSIGALWLTPVDAAGPGPKMRWLPQRPKPPVKGPLTAPWSTAPVALMPVTRRALLGENVLVGWLLRVGGAATLIGFFWAAFHGNHSTLEPAAPYLLVQALVIVVYLFYDGTVKDLPWWRRLYPTRPGAAQPGVHFDGRHLHVGGRRLLDLQAPFTLHPITLPQGTHHGLQLIQKRSHASPNTVPKRVTLLVAADPNRPSPPQVAPLKVAAPVIDADLMHRSLWPTLLGHAALHGPLPDVDLVLDND